jgi:photosystem II stability/assembly factor-like uncharacterized protein
MNADDDLIADAMARRALTATEEGALSSVRGFIGRHEFAAKRRHTKLAVELLVAAAVSAIAVTLIVTLMRHMGPTSSVSSRPHPPTPPVVVTSPMPTPSAPPVASCKGSASPAGQSFTFPTLSSIQAIGSTHVWAVGYGRIISSHDGGRTWRVEYTGPEQLAAFDAIDDTHAWAVGGDALLGTSDGGNTWLPLGEPASPLTSVHFVSETTGFGVVQGSCPLVTTTDGGRSWQPVDAAPKSGTSVCFVDDRNGWVGAAGQVWRTGDGGATWHSVLDTRNDQVGPDQVALQCAAPEGVSIEASSTGAAAGSVPNAAWVSSGGDHFTQVWAGGQWLAPSTVANGPGSYPGPFSIVSTMITVWIGNTPAQYPNNADLLETNGHQVAAAAAQVTCRGAVNGAAFISATRGWALCTDESGSTPEYAVLVTADGGHTWAVQYRVP